MVSRFFSPSVHVPIHLFTFPNNLLILICFKYLFIIPIVPRFFYIRRYIIIYNHVVTAAKVHTKEIQEIFNYLYWLNDSWSTSLGVKFVLATLQSFFPSNLGNCIVFVWFNKPRLEVLHSPRTLLTRHFVSSVSFLSNLQRSLFQIFQDILHTSVPSITS